MDKELKGMNEGKRERNYGKGRERKTKQSNDADGWNLNSSTLCSSRVARTLLLKRLRSPARLTSRYETGSARLETLREERETASFETSAEIKRVGG